MTTENNTFQYTYSAKQQAEIENIRRKYAPSTSNEDKMELLRRLDANVTKKPTMASIIIGVIGTLIMGTGMSFVLVWQGLLFVPGIVIGVIGIALLSTAYPVYNIILKKEREKAAPEILKLTEELLQ